MMLITDKQMVDARQANGEQILIIRIVGLLILWLPFLSIASAQDPELQALFAKHQVTGTIIIESLSGDKRYVHNVSRSTQAFSTASTFKIPNTLIALNENLIVGADSVIKWDGVERDYAVWNKDQTLRSAFQFSCVWCYQYFASKIGSIKYREYIAKLGYGDLKSNFNTTTFWLDNGITITADQQIEFLRGVQQRRFPFADRSYNTLRDIMLVESTESYQLRAKTGWAARVNPQVGWFVGYLEAPDEVWLFATNLEITKNAQLPLRKAITLEAMQIKKLID